MKFEPKTEDQILDLLPEGEYEYTVIQAEEKKSGTGNDMIVLHCLTNNHEGRGKVVKAWLVANFHKTLKHFTDASGLQDKYEFGEITAKDCEGKKGIMVVGIKENERTSVKYNHIHDFKKITTGNPFSHKNTHESKDADIAF